MKRILAVLLAVMLLVAVVPATSLAEVKANDSFDNVYHVTTKKDPLLLRSDHSKDAHILARLPKGSAVILLSQKKVKEDKIEWVKVRSIYGLTGWVATADKGRKLIDKKAHAEVVTKNDPLNVRPSPNTKKPAITKIPRGTKRVPVLRVDGNWAKVTWNKKTGWASLTYLRWMTW